MILYIYLYIIVFFIGASFGSFLNALSYRIHNKMNFLISRSECDFCKRKLNLLDLIPVVSFLTLRGRCRYCKAKLSYEYLISEIILGFFFLLAFVNIFPKYIWDLNYFYLYSVFLFFNICIFFYIAIYDYKYYIISDYLVLFLILLYSIGLVTIYILFLQNNNFLLIDQINVFIVDHILAAFALFIFFYLLYFITKGRGMGGGDVKLVFPIGLLLGLKLSIIFLYISFSLGAFLSLVLIALKFKKMKDVIPFGPFLAIGLILAILYGEQLLNTQFFNFINLFDVIHI